MVYKIILAVALLVFACTGDQGPVGPAGPAGPEGPTGQPGEDGAVITDVVGVISSGNYDGVWIEIDAVENIDDAVIQVYINPDSEAGYWWLYVDDINFRGSLVCFYDPNQQYLGWEYWVKIIWSN